MNRGSKRAKVNKLIDATIPYVKADLSSKSSPFDESFEEWKKKHYPCLSLDPIYKQKFLNPYWPLTNLALYFFN